jgi:hypothetical protein
MVDDGSGSVVNSRGCYKQATVEMDMWRDAPIIHTWPNIKGRQKEAMPKGEMSLI